MGFFEVLFILTVLFMLVAVPVGAVILILFFAKKTNPSVPQETATSILARLETLENRVAKMEAGHQTPPPQP